jgi:transmembrane sensor
MKFEHKPSPADINASEQAAAWFARQRVSPLSEADLAAFATWLKTDPAHTSAWLEFERLWGRVDAVRDDPKILAIRDEATHRAARREGTWHGGRRLAAAMAASIVVGVAVWWGLPSPAFRPGEAPTLAQAPGMTDSGVAQVREASTQIGERSILVLADGSKVTLNTASAVRADYRGHDRRLTLVRGEAFFDVAKDPARPFIVTAGSRQVVAVGTAFDVRLQDQQVKITLVEGKVRVVPATGSTSGSAIENSAASTVTLEAGTALVAEANGAERVEQLDTARATSWRSGKLVFEGERLADVVTEMNRYSIEKIEISDPALENRKVSGVFEPTEAHAFTKALQAYGIARATQQSTTTIVLGAP